MLVFFCVAMVMQFDAELEPPLEDRESITYVPKLINKGDVQQVGRQTWTPGYS